MIREAEKNNSNPFYKCIEYVLEKEVLGYLEYLYMYDRIEIANIFVKEEFRNRRIGTNMLKYVIDFAKEKGLVNITLEVNTNNVYAIKLYENFGFKSVAIRKGYYNGEDGILMELKL